MKVLIWMAISGPRFKSEHRCLTNLFTETETCTLLTKPLSYDHKEWLETIMNRVDCYLNRVDLAEPS